jgi:hypothetical protein
MSNKYFLNIHEKIKSYKKGKSFENGGNVNELGKSNGGQENELMLIIENKRKIIEVVNINKFIRI